MSGELSVFCIVLQFRHQYYDGYLKNAKKRRYQKEDSPVIVYSSQNQYQC